jgi:hypothetical protein
MKLRNKGSQEVYDVPSGVGKALIVGGLAEEVKAEPVRPVPNSNWRVVDGGFTGDYQAGPAIAVSCSTCGLAVGMRGPSCYKTQKFSHCGIFELPSQDVVNDFLRRLEAYNKRGKRRPPTINGTSNDLYLRQQQSVAAGMGLPVRDEAGKVVKTRPIF